MSKRILIVEDEANIVVSLEFLLGQEGHQVKVATSGEEALALAAEYRPDLVLLDVMLPGIDGFEVCRRLRDLETAAAVMPSPRPRIILLTAHDREAERMKGLDLGADLYVTKPFSTRALLADVRRCLEGTSDAEPDAERS